jgi:oxygen-independent coproporphyrinogen-3 oxidase
LQICGRIHNSSDNVKAVDDAVKAGFKNINVDIMYGLPGQSLHNVLGSIERAVKLGATHISLYGLKVEEGTPFYSMQAQKKLELPDEDTESDMYFVSCNLLKNLGFKHYEISNFAKPGFESVHNLKYWNCDEYVGFGPSAHSFFAGKRFYYKNSTSLYIKNFTENYDGQGIVDKCIDVQFGTQMAEYVMLRMRLGEGINCDEFKRRFGRTFESVYLTKMTPFLRSGHIVKTVDGYAFTEQGMYVSNYILSRMIDFDIANFEFDTVVYYDELVNHLGSAARYQLLGSLFAKKKISGMDCEVPAIEGKMGNLTYYSFSSSQMILFSLQNCSKRIS